MDRTESLTRQAFRRSTRVLTYLRVSVTDRCSFRCLYCSPAGQAHSSASLLSAAEIGQVVRVAQQLGVTHVRLTGGEPLERPDVVDIVKRIKSLGIPEISLTTNGVRLADLAGPLRQAGLARVNVGLPHVEADGFRRITGEDALAETLSGIRAARAAGLMPVKTNTVVMRGYNDNAVCAILELGRREGVTVRFIEYMTSAERTSKELFVPADEVLRQLRRHFELTESPGETDGRGTRGPARYYRLGGGGVVGVIAPVSAPFCRSCNRLRLSATGKLRPCLYSEDEVDLVPALRAADSEREWRRHSQLAPRPVRAERSLRQARRALGTSEAWLADAFEQAMAMKPTEHGAELPTEMRFIGG